MARLEAVIPEEIKELLIKLATLENRSITKELIQLIEQEYKKKFSGTKKGGK